jgi:hypothetical protein
MPAAANQRFITYLLLEEHRAPANYPETVASKSGQGLVAARPFCCREA